MKMDFIELYNIYYKPSCPTAEFKMAPHQVEIYDSAMAWSMKAIERLCFNSALDALCHKIKVLDFCAPFL